jgi:hypothetical protein
LHQLYTDEDVFSDKALVGTWSEEDSQEVWAFKEGAEKAYDLTYTSKGESAEFEVHLIRLGKATFMDIYPKEQNKIKNDMYLAHLVPAHTFSKIDLKGDVLSISTFAPSSELYEDKELDIAHEDVESGIVLTAPTDELQKYMRKHADDEGSFDEPMELHRQK